MNFLIENWYIIVAMVAVALLGIAFAARFAYLPTEKQLEKVREWLLWAVTEAETALGGGTGQLKLRYVYDLFVQRFAWLAKVISFEKFSDFVDEALEEMWKMLETNESAKKLVEKGKGV